MTLGQRVFQLLVAVDQAINCCIWINDTWADETFSAKCYRLREKAFWATMMRFTDWLFWAAIREQDHCQRAYESERKREQSPLEQR